MPLVRELGVSYKIFSLSSNSRGERHATLGSFDAFHLGHQALLQKVAERKGRSSLVSFVPHPQRVIKGFTVPRLTSLKERIDILKKAGFDELILIHFSKPLSSHSASTFIKSFFVEELNLASLTIGPFTALGKGREADAVKICEILSQEGIGCTVISPVEKKGIRYSSTLVREQLKNGELESAKESLGRYYSVDGGVIEGKKLGRVLGFPTANIRSKQYLPKEGIYGVLIEGEGIDGVKSGAASLGPQPTFNQKESVLEVHILGDNSYSLYGKKVRVYFVKYLREIKKYNSEKELIQAINRDIALVKETPIDNRFIW